MRRLFSILTFAFWFCFEGAHAQNFTTILGRPTDTSVTINILFDTTVDVYWEYGTANGQLTTNSSVYTAVRDSTLEINLASLQPNTRYFYRTRYRLSGSTASFNVDSVHSFQTQRRMGTSFSFVVEADPHLDSNCNPDSYRLTLQHMLSKQPDFLIDLGDNTMNDKLPVINRTSIVERTLLFRNYFNELTHSVPLYITLGNHEGELGWLPNTGTSSLPTLAALLRKTYFPNPFPNVFYSGNTVSEPYIGLRENYYAWEWGDALFVVIDPYIFTKSKPEWGWTLGSVQYNWLKNTLTDSKAKFKFIFSHQLVGGSGTDGRGGSEFVHLYEMGGRNSDSTYGFSANRPGWYKPLHDLFIETGVNIFFHGHDHLFAKQDKDRVVYQEVPQPSAKNLQSVTGTAYGYKEGTLLPNRGYMYVTVNESQVKVDYIRTYLPSEENATRKNGDIAYSYTIRYSPVTGVHEIVNPIDVSVFPVPAHEKIYIQYPSTVLKFSYRLLDLTGKVMRSSTEREIDTGKLPASTYFLQLTTDEITTVRKIVVLH
jgi:hypothetical protein